MAGLIKCPTCRALASVAAPAYVENECPICLEKEDEHRVLTCGHLFCVVCMDNLKQRSAPLPPSVPTPSPVPSVISPPASEADDDEDEPFILPSFPWHFRWVLEPTGWYLHTDAWGVDRWGRWYRARRSILGDGNVVPSPPGVVGGRIYVHKCSVQWW